MKKRAGDTLVEVTLAIGIFSMVAVAVVAVMSSGTSNTQTALETTLTREEIDIQAEALRFIHSAYLSNLNNPDNPYVKLWSNIVERAINPSVEGESYLTYAPTTCKNAMESETLENYGFIINPLALSTDTENAYISYQGNEDKFFEASTFPRLVYDTSEGTLLDTPTELYHIEGIYVIAVQDESTTRMVNYSSGAAAFYDFYIRTCWYGSGSDTPTTISTVIRLHNPSSATNTMP